MNATDRDESDGLKERMRRIKLLLLDVDGVLTDGGLYYTEGGEQMKRFCVRDGLGIKLLQQAGIEIAFVTGLKSNMVEQRAASLGIVEVAQGAMVKEPVVEEMLKRRGLKWEQVGYIGDDLIDVPVMRLTGFSVAVADAEALTKKTAHYVTRLPGGRGAVREVCNMILAARGNHNPTRHYTVEQG